MAFRGPTPVADASPLGVQNASTHSVHNLGPAPEYSLVGATEIFEDGEITLPSEPERQDHAIYANHDESKFAFFEDEDQTFATATGESGATTGHIGAPPEYVETFTTYEHGNEEVSSFTEPETELAVAQSGDEFTVEEPCALAETEIDSVPISNPVDDQTFQQSSIEEPISADSWSEGEWPVLIGPATRQSFRLVRAAIAAVIVLAVVGSLYFLIYRQSSSGQEPTVTGTTAPVSTVAQARAVTSEASNPNPVKRLSSTASDGLGGSQAAKPMNSPVVSNESSNAQGRFSLQAAAFPTQSGADEFAEKLKQLGVPSYVVPADLVRRGRWFRVRVGRFNSADDAQRFAGEAQSRARTAGLTLQLIVCQYDQP